MDDWYCGEKKGKVIDRASEGNVDILVRGVIDDGVEGAADIDAVDTELHRKEAVGRDLNREDPANVK